MQPRNIEVFDGLRVTTDHFDHLQGSIHSAFADFRGILGLGRVHRGFAVTRVDAHAVQVDPGLAFDTQRRRVISDEPVRLEIPATGDPAVRFVCVAYDQRADGDVEGRPTRIWDSARVDVRAAPPARTDDAIVLAELQPADNEEGFTIHVPTRGDGAVPAEPVVSAPAPPPVAAAPLAWRLGTVAFAPTTLDALVLHRIAAAIRTGAAGDGAAFSERLASGEVLVGVKLAAVATHATARMALRIGAHAGEAEVAAVPGNAGWRWDASADGHVVVADDGTLTQHGAGMTALRGPTARSSAAAFTKSSVLSTAATDAAGDGGGDEALQAFVTGLRFMLRLAPRNSDGFAVDAWLEWNGAASDALARRIEEGLAALTWEAELGWTVAGTPPAIVVSSTRAPSAGG